MSVLVCLFTLRHIDAAAEEALGSFLRNTQMIISMEILMMIVNMVLLMVMKVEINVNTKEALSFFT